MNHNQRQVFSQGAVPVGTKMEWVLARCSARSMIAIARVESGRAIDVSARADACASQC